MSEEEASKGADANAEAEAARNEAEASSTAEAEPRERRRKKKARPKKTPSPRSELNAQGMERPAFLLDFPEDAELEPLIAAFEAGNYAFVRERAPRLVETTESAEVKASAQELLRRIEPDPLVKFLLGVAIALFVAVVAYVYHSHGN